MPLKGAAMRKPIVAGNWKMNLTAHQAEAMVEELLSLGQTPESVESILIPNFLCIPLLAEKLKGTGYQVGAQNMSSEDQGAFTGEISWDMLKEFDVSYCIIGHSERRTLYLENNSQIEKKLRKAVKTGIKPILCVGESLEKRQAGEAKKRIEGQVHRALVGLDREDLQDLVIAYEPIWAIGSGQAATPEDAEDMCLTIRQWIEKGYGSDLAEKIRILYGGSVKPDNIASFMEKENIDGALVGGASLKAKDFYGLIEATKNA